MSAVLAVAQYTTLEALRNRLLWLVVGFVVGGFTFAEFIGEVAITESAEFQSSFLGAVLRVSAVFMVSLFVITSMVREFNDKGLELVLSQPIARATYFVGKLLGFAGLALFTAALYALALLIYTPVDQALMWGISLTAELLIVMTFSLLCLFTFAHVTLALSVVMAFYVLARTITALQLIGQGPLGPAGQLSQQVIGWLMSGLGFLLPELDRFTSSEWLVYHTGQWQDLWPILGQSVIYVALLSGAALFDLYRKNL